MTSCAFPLTDAMKAKWLEKRCSSGQCLLLVPLELCLVLVCVSHQFWWPFCEQKSVLISSLPTLLPFSLGHVKLSSSTEPGSASPSSLPDVLHITGQLLCSWQPARSSSRHFFSCLAESQEDQETTENLQEKITCVFIKEKRTLP